jgi:hypothetical protein
LSEDEALKLSPYGIYATVFLSARCSVIARRLSFATIQIQSRTALAFRHDSVSILRSTCLSPRFCFNLAQHLPFATIPFQARAALAFRHDSVAILHGACPSPRFCCNLARCLPSPRIGFNFCTALAFTTILFQSRTALALRHETYRAANRRSFY